MGCGEICSGTGSARKSNSDRRRQTDGDRDRDSDTTDRPTDGRTDRQTDRQTDGQTDAPPALQAMPNVTSEMMQKMTMTTMVSF